MLSTTTGVEKIEENQAYIGAIIEYERKLLEVYGTETKNKTVQDSVRGGTM